MNKKYFAMVDPVTGAVTQLTRVNARTGATQKGMVEIDQAKYEAISADDSLDFFLDNRGGLTSRPKVIPYSKQRRGRYPDIGEQLDGIIKGLRQLYAANGIRPNDDTKRLLDEVETVKKRFPKTP